MIVEPVEPARALPVPAETSLGDRTARGFAFMIAQGLATKLLALLGQIVLARWLLDERDFGVFALASAVFTFTCLPQLAGTAEVLVHRQSTFRRWANAAWWMSLALGLAGAAVTAAAAPIAGHIFADPDIASVLLVLALAVVPIGLQAVPNARLSSELRFGHAALTGTAGVVTNTGLSICLAWLGDGTNWGGPFALAWARVLTAVLQLAILLLIAAPRLRWRLHVRRWRSLIIDNTWLMLGKIALLGVSQGDYLVLGLMASERAVGLYFFAFSLSMQTMALVTTNLGAVLFPALSKMTGSAEQQARAFLRAARKLALVAVPACFLQAALAEPVMLLLFNGKWIDAIPLLQILSLGMALRAVGSPAGSLLLAQGRFRAVMWVNAAYAIVFIAAVAAGAALAVEVGVAVAAALFFAVLGPVHVYVAVRGAGAGLGWSDVGEVFVRPVLCSALAVGAGWFISHALPLPASPLGLLARCGVCVGVVLPTYLLLARATMGDSLRGLASRLSRMPGGGRAARLLTGHGQRV